MGSFEPNTPPAISIARLAMTSLAFMLVCVPLPVCQTRNGNCALSVPAITSSAACTMSRALADVREHGRRIKCTRAIGDRTAQQTVGAFGYTGLHLLVQVVPQVVPGQWPH